MVDEDGVTTLSSVLYPLGVGVLVFSGLSILEVGVTTLSFLSVVSVLSVLSVL